MKEFISGAISAFALVTVYNLFKAIMKNKKYDNDINRDVIPDIIQNTEKEVDIQPKPKLFSFNKDYIDSRKELTLSSGFVLISSRNKGIYYFKHEIENVLQNTDDKVVIFDTHQYFKPVIMSLGADYAELSSDELQDDIMDKYESAIDDINAKCPDIAPLTERITCFNVWKDEDVKNALRYIYMRARFTPHSDSQQRIWLYIPSWEVATYHSKELLRIMQRSRMAGIITTASSEVDDIIINDEFRYKVNSFDYLAFTDDIDNYYSNDTLKDLICCIDKAYQFDINFSEKEQYEIKQIAWGLVHDELYTDK